jgi:hypothetical protein
VGHLGQCQSNQNSLRESDWLISDFVGQCLAAILKDVERWHASKEVYIEEALGTDDNEGFAESRHGMRLEGTRLLTWEMFKNMSYKWHRRLTKVRSDVLWLDVQTLD